MITIQQLTWSNWFSYGSNNTIDLSSNKLTQISGVNGSGKSSIPIIIEEVAYSKNHKPFKKQQLVNRYLDNPILSAELYFLKDNDEYVVKLKRKSTISLSLFKNGVDISSHTSTGTYTTLQNILGIDFNTFCQLIYQSSKNNLEFLTATDTNRKKFLINLFGLTKYLDIHEEFKKISTKVNNEIQQLSGQIAATEAWIKLHEGTNLDEEQEMPVPIINEELINELTDLKSKLSIISETNKRINDNNQYKLLLKELDTSIINENIVIPDKKDIIKRKRQIEIDKIQYEQKVKLYEDNIKDMENLGEICPTCRQTIESEIKESIINTSRSMINEIKDVKIVPIVAEFKKLDSELQLIYELEKRYSQREKVSDELTKLLNLIDNELDSEVQDKDELTNKINELSAKIMDIEVKKNKAIKFNNVVSAHNAKVKVIKQQLIEYKEQLNNLSEQISIKEKIFDILNILKKAFGTSGLPSFKIEFLSKELEIEINVYLDELSKGRFQLNFNLSGEKLNIDILDDGKVITIEELSTGELARVNTATLLAIRKLMSAISETKLNILFLDEIMGVLDEEGKDKLIEILMNEEDLNTFLVSHEFSHPLIPKINIIKENRISRIENG